ncbi:DUF4012 domain-containing protein [Nocardioides sp. YIM 152588]|uniref:DUF4012 domain-containing protein n=1 Tax=Nocardioides sp. YIM 152588 TaxID=3158259 RepID=UPI0032E4472A
MRSLWIGGAVAATLVLGVAVWCAWQAWQVARSLEEAVDHASALRSALTAEDADAAEATAAAEVELAALREASADAADRTDTATWGMLTRLPWLGDDAHGVRTTSRVIDDLATDGLAPLLEVSDRVDQLLPHGGAVDLDALRDLSGPVSDAQQAFDDADRTLQAEDASGFTTRLADRFHDFRGQVAQADKAMTAASTTLDILPGMLGADEPRTILMVFQNNAEIRATGGLPGAVTALHADDGVLTIGRQVSGGSFGETAAPVLPLTKPERDQFGNLLGTYFVNANLTPDVPRAADLMRARWELAYPGESVDGVLLVDTVSLGYVLDETGPITVDGIELRGDTVVEELLHTTYLRLDDPRAQDQFFADVAAEAFERFTSGAGGGAGLVGALAQSVDEHRVFAHSFHTEEQEHLSGSPVAGELITDPEVKEPQITVTMNDTTAAKLSYFLRYEVDANATYCTDGVQGFAAKARLWSTAPTDAADLPAYVAGRGVTTEPGSQIVTVRVLAPAGGRAQAFTLNAKPLTPLRTVQDGRPVAEFYIELAPGQKVDLAWTMRGGAGQTGDSAYTVTPSIAEQDHSGSIESACR